MHIYTYIHIFIRDTYRYLSMYTQHIYTRAYTHMHIHLFLLVDHYARFVFVQQHTEAYTLAFDLHYTYKHLRCKHTHFHTRSRSVHECINGHTRTLVHICTWPCFHDHYACIHINISDHFVFKIKNNIKVTKLSGDFDGLRPRRRDGCAPNAAFTVTSMSRGGTRSFACSSGAMCVPDSRRLSS